jgi:hypothetical protein
MSIKVGEETDLQTSSESSRTAYTITLIKMVFTLRMVTSSVDIADKLFMDKLQVLVMLI